jgi:hypothetical protein
MDIQKRIEDLREGNKALLSACYEGWENLSSQFIEEANSYLSRSSEYIESLQGVLDAAKKQCGENIAVSNVSPFVPGVVKVEYSYKDEREFVFPHVTLVLIDQDREQHCSPGSSPELLAPVGRSPQH